MSGRYVVRMLDRWSDCWMWYGIVYSGEYRSHRYSSEDLCVGEWRRASTPSAEPYATAYYDRGVESGKIYVLRSVRAARGPVWVPGPRLRRPRPFRVSIFHAPWPPRRARGSRVRTEDGRKANDLHRRTCVCCRCPQIAHLLQETAHARIELGMTFSAS